MNTCKDCIYYVVCGQYDMYGDCAEKCFDFFQKPHSAKQVRAKTSAVKTRKKLLMPIVIVVSQKGQSYE